MNDKPNPHDELDPAKLERLLENVGRLPREVDPPAGAWPAIRQRIEAQRVRSIAPASDTTPAPRAVPRWFAAAAGLVIVVGATVFLSSRTQSPEPGQVAADSASPSSLLPPVGPATPLVPASLATANPSLAAVLDQYHQASRELEAEVASRTAELSPATREVVRRSLATIDTAIADLRAALGANPRDAAAGQAISAVYERKLEFLKRVRALPAVGM